MIRITVACILSVLLIGANSGVLPQPALAAPPSDSLLGQISRLQSEITALQAQVNALQTKVEDLSLLVVHTKPGIYTFTEGTNDLVPLDVVEGNPITQSNQFITGGDFTVTYTATCAVAAAQGNDLPWMNLEIELVNVATNEVVVLAPSNGTDDAFCTANGTLGFNGWNMVSITGVAKNLPRANYTVQIRANIQRNFVGTASGSLSQSSLIVRK